MRKLIVLIIVLALVGGYTAFWFKKADDFKAMITQSIDALNQQGSAINKDVTLLRFNTIEASGYPFEMKIKITQPVIDVPVSALVARINHAVLPVGAPPAKDWVEEIKYSDAISVGVNLTGTNYTMSMDGDRNETSIIDHTPKNSFVATSSPFVCHLKIAQDKVVALWSMEPLFTSTQSFLETFREADCDTSNLTTKMADSGKVLSTLDGLTLKTSHEPTDATNHKLAFVFDVKNAQSTADMDQLVANYLDQVYSLPGMAGKNRVFIAPSAEYGAQNVSIDIQYEGPASGADLNNPAAHVKFDVNKFELHSALFNASSQAHVASAASGETRTGSVVIHSELDSTERYDQLVTKQMAQNLSTAMNNPGKTDPNTMMMQAFIGQMGTPDEIASVIMPKFHEFGKMVFDVNASAKGAADWNNFFKSGELKVDALDWTATPYGIKLKGTSTGGVAPKKPTSDFTLNCLSCDALIDDLGHYAMRIEVLFNRTQPGKAPFISANLIGGVKDFVHGIAADKAAKDLSITFVMKDTGEFTVSGKSLNELMGLYMTTIAPTLQKPGAPTGSSTFDHPANVSPDMRVMPLPQGR